MNRAAREAIATAEQEIAQAKRRRGRARGRHRGQHKPGEMNKLEQQYAELLEERKLAGEILEYRFEGVKLRLADRTFLTVDFFVLHADLEVEMHEVKGFWEDDARVKIKVAASMYPFRFLGITRERGRWVYEEF